MIEYDFEGYAKSQIDKALGYLEGFSKGYHQAKSEWVELTDEEILTEWFKIFAPEPGIGKNVTSGVFEFAKAILEIAQTNCNKFCGEIECKENKTRCKRQKTNET